MSVFNEAEAALAAAHAASEATASLLQFAREGEHSKHFAFDEATVEKLADALNLTLEIEMPRVRTAFAKTENARELEHEAELLAKAEALQAALDAFLEGWA